MRTIENLENGNILVHVDYFFTRHGGRKKLVLEGVEAAGDNRDMKVLKAIARGFRWQKLIEDGKFESTVEIAMALRTDSSYVARTIRLTYLAPKIIQMFLNGTAPSSLSLARLSKSFPEDWNKQYEFFGIE